MKIINSFEEFSKIEKGISCALGSFDGLHLGHERVINEMLFHAINDNLASMVITFDMHPMELLKKDKPIKYILSSEERNKCLSQIGIDYLFLIPMNYDLLKTEMVDFISLLQKGKLKHISVGENYTFGNKGIGKPKDLKYLMNKIGCQVHEMPLFKLGAKESLTFSDNVDIKNGDIQDSEIVSSTRIRKLLSEGNLRLANNLLGYNFPLYGKVIYGDQRGRTLGFPTANILWPQKKVILPDGVFVNKVLVGNKWYKGIGNIGNNPTFEDQYHRFEVHLFDFKEDIYGENIYVEFLEFLRGEERFSSLDELIEQMEDDKVKALNYFEKHGHI